MAAENESLKFKIGDDEYDIPMLDDLDMDEWQILYDYTGLILDDFAPAIDKAPETATQMRLEAELKVAKLSNQPAEEIAEIAQELGDEEARRAEEDGPKEKDRRRRTSQPGFTRAMLHVGYRRAHPELKPDAIRQVTGSAKLLRVLEAMGESAGDEDDTEAAPLASTTELEKSSPRSSVDSSEIASPPSPTSSARRAVQAVPTGTDG